MPSKKRKLTFDFDNVEKRSEETQRIFLELNKALENCHISDNEALNFLDPEEFLNFAAIKCGYHFIQNLFLVLNAVPEESGPWRAEITRKLLLYSSGKTALTKDEESIVQTILQSSTFRDGIYKFAESYSQVFAKCLYHNRGKNAFYSKADEFPPFAGCIAPATKVCLVCNQELQKHNKPCLITYYLASGPLPFLKVELRCRTCEINYGIVKYGNSTDGYKHYDNLGVIEASDVVYIDRLVMAMFTSLR